jgi:predicted small secreted protein
MKRNLLIITLLVVSLALTACGSGSTTSTTAGTDAASASAGNAAPSQGTLSPVARNILGIFKLEGTDLAVDSTQAAMLLPLWQAYRSLLNSDTTAPVELEALQTQIGEALTAEQQDAIAAMDLSPQDMFAVAQELGVTTFVGAGDRSDASGTRPSFGGAGSGGAAGGMAPPGGGMGPPAGSVFIGGPDGGPPSDAAGALDPQAIATFQAGRPAGAGQGDRLSLALLDPLIDLLKERVGS